MSSEDQLRLTAQIVDQFSGPLREMTKSVHNFQDFMRGGTKQTIKDNKEHAKLQKDLNEQFINTGRTITGILTPAMGALGLSVGGAGASIVALIANLKNAGGEFYKLQGAMARTGLSLPELDAQSRMISKITGQTVEASQAQLSSLGDVARQLSRNYAPTMQALEGTFNNLHGLITKMSGDTAAQAIDDFMAYYESHPASPDQQRKLLSAVGINPDLANASADQIRKTLEQQRQFVSANPLLDQDTRKKLRDAFDELDDSADGFGRHMLAAFGGDTVKIVNNLAGAINSLAGVLGDQVKKELSDIKAIMDGIDTVGRHLGFRDDSPEQKKFDEDNKGKVIPNLLQQHRSPSTAPTGPGVFPGGSYHPTSFTTGGSSSDAESLLSRGVKRGTLDALREWAASVSGMQNAAYTTGGGGGNPMLGGNIPKFGNKDFPNLGDGVAGAGGGGHRKLAKALGMDHAVTGASGNLAQQRAGLMKELNTDPQLKALAIGAMQHEGGIQSNMEQLFNYAAMRHMTIRQALHSGQYGPVNRIGDSLRNISDKTRRQGEAALSKVGEGSNITDYATDQGMQGDPNFAKYMSNRSYWNMHKVEGAWFSSHGEQGRKWAQRERDGDRDLLANANKAGMGGGSQTVSGGADLRVAFENAPSGMKANLKNWGVFGDPAKVDWGHAMSPSDPGGR